MRSRDPMRGDTTKTPSPSTGEGWGEGDHHERGTMSVPVVARLFTFGSKHEEPLALALSRKGRGKYRAADADGAVHS